MREIRTSGSEGGEGQSPFPTPITSLPAPDPAFRRNFPIIARSF
jgi:hypothetical protein